jgi:hypothetical protein
MPTTNFLWETPDNGGDEGSWGTILNATLEEIDADLKAAKDTADAALPKTGGVVTGRVDLKTATIAKSDLGGVSGTVTLDLAVAQYFTLSITGPTALVFANVPAGTFAIGVILRVTNGEAALLTWPVSVQWPGGTKPVLTTDGVDILVLLSDDSGTTWRGMVAARDIS